MPGPSTATKEPKLSPEEAAKKAAAEKELAAYEAATEDRRTELARDLITKFDQYDGDQNGLLSPDEIKPAVAKVETRPTADDGFSVAHAHYRALERTVAETSPGDTKDRSAGISPSDLSERLNQRRLASEYFSADQIIQVEHQKWLAGKIQNHFANHPEVEAVFIPDIEKEFTAVDGIGSIPRNVVSNMCYAINGSDDRWAPITRANVEKFLAQVESLELNPAHLKNFLDRAKQLVLKREQAAPDQTRELEAAKMEGKKTEFEDLRLPRLSPEQKARAKAYHEKT